MKKFILLFAITLLFSCDNDDNNNSQLRNTEFLLKTISPVQFGTSSTTYNYNDDNLITNITRSLSEYPINFLYDNGTLKEINYKDEYQGQINDIIYNFNELDELGGHANISSTSQISPLYPAKEFEVEFDGLLIKSLKWMFIDGKTLTHQFEHDSTGRLTEFTTLTSGFPIPPCSIYSDRRYTITEWDTNESSSSFNFTERILTCRQLEYLIFPKHYLSTKNPKKIISESLVSGSQDELNISYGYDDNGNTISLEIGGLDTIINATYIEAN